MQRGAVYIRARLFRRRWSAGARLGRGALLGGQGQDQPRHWRYSGQQPHDRKNLEHVFAKLGVETRTAAAGMAMSRIRQLHSQFEG